MGTVIGMRSDVKSKCIVIEKVSEEYEATWIKLTNKNNIHIKIGNIYAPQECRTKKSIIKKMYRNIKDHITESRMKDERIIITGDFNCKIGKHIMGNREEVSTFGKLLLELASNEEMDILNANSKCKGMWTRIEGGTKSVIDYVLVQKEDTKYLNEMIIDEEKTITPCHVVNKRTIYSDHCAILIKMNWYLATKEQHQKSIKVVNNKTLTDFKRKTSGQVLTKIAKNKENIVTKYNKWNDHIKKIMKQCFTKTKTRKEMRTKTIENLYREKRISRYRRKSKQDSQKI